MQHKILILVCVVGALFRSYRGECQQNNLLYFFDRIPQSTQLNPALQPSCTFYFGLPVISTVEINAGNNALGVSDILIQDNELDMLITPLYSKSTITQTLNKLRKNNIVSAGLQVDLLSFGFKVRDSYVSFVISDKTNVSTNIPKSLAIFALEGMEVGSQYNFENLCVKANYYREYAFSLSQKVNERLNFGVRGKLLFGKADISSQQTNISINEPDWKTLNVSASLKVNSSVPNIEVINDDNGKPDSIHFKEFENTNNLINDLILLNKNRGFGFDLGFQYALTKKIAISGSLLDLGYINWKSNLNTIEGSGDYSFHGINLNQDDSVNIAESLMDTLKRVYDVSLSHNPYTTLLTPKLYFGIAYSPNKFFKLGMLSRTEYILKTFRQQFTGSLTLYPSQPFAATFSYTITDNMHDNFGLGLLFKGGPLQMYFMSERIPLFWNQVKADDVPFLPVYAKSFNFRMGFSFVFGSNKDRKLKKDQPFLE